MVGSRIIAAAVLVGSLLAGLGGAGLAWASERVSARGQIVGGKPAAPGQFPYMAFVAYNSSGHSPGFLCTGTLVSSNVVLTAGHCTVSETTGALNDASRYRVLTGALDWQRPSQGTVSTVSKVEVDPNYDRQGPKHDAGVLILSSPVSQPAVHMWASGQVDARTPAEIAGWGETSAGSGPSKQLRWAPTVIQSSSFCGRSAPSDFMFDSSSMLCAQDTPTDKAGSCNGDSGGPLLVKQSSGAVIEVGVTSVGPSNCSTHQADFYTAVRPIEPWVSSQIRAFAP